MDRWAGVLEIVKFLLNRRACVDFKNARRRTALFHCTKLTIPDALLLAGWNLEHCDNTKWRLLHNAAPENRSDIIRRFLELHADVNARDSLDRTPRQLAILYNPVEAVRALREAQTGFATDVYRERPLHDAALYAGPELMPELALFDLRAVDPLHQVKVGSTPDSCFYKFWEGLCTIIRRPFKDEEAAWIELMESVCRHNGYVYRSWKAVESKCVKMAEEVDASESGESNISSDGVYEGDYTDADEDSDDG